MDFVTGELVLVKVNGLLSEAGEHWTRCFLCVCVCRGGRSVMKSQSLFNRLKSNQILQHFSTSPPLLVDGGLQYELFSFCSRAGFTCSFSQCCFFNHFFFFFCFTFQTVEILGSRQRSNLVPFAAFVLFFFPFLSL